MPLLLPGAWVISGQSTHGVAVTAAQLEVDVKFGNLELVVKTIYLFVIYLS